MLIWITPRSRTRRTPVNRFADGQSIATLSTASSALRGLLHLDNSGYTHNDLNLSSGDSLAKAPVNGPCRGSIETAPIAHALHFAPFSILVFETTRLIGLEQSLRTLVLLGQLVVDDSQLSTLRRSDPITVPQNASVGQELQMLTKDLMLHHHTAVLRRQM